MVYDLYEYQNQSFDVNIWSKIISDASMVVFQFPFHWMSAPSLLKRWLDEVFTSLAKTPPWPVSLCKSLRLPDRNMRPTGVADVTASLWMNCCVLIRAVLSMPEWFGKRLWLSMAWGQVTHPRTLLLVRKLINRRWKPCSLIMEPIVLGNSSPIYFHSVFE